MRQQRCCPQAVAASRTCAGGDLRPGGALAGQGAVLGAPRGAPKGTAQFLPPSAGPPVARLPVPFVVLSPRFAHAARGPPPVPSGSPPICRERPCRAAATRLRAASSVTSGVASLVAVRRHEIVRRVTRSRSDTKGLSRQTPVGLPSSGTFSLGRET